MTLRRILVLLPLVLVFETCLFAQDLRMPAEWEPHEIERVVPLSPDDLDLQQRARAFVDTELIPHEVEAELHAGNLPAEVLDRQRRRAAELGLLGISVPVEHGGPGYTTLQQALVSEQIGRVTNTLGWVVTTPPRWLPAYVGLGSNLDDPARQVALALNGLARLPGTRRVVVSPLSSAGVRYAITASSP